MSILNLYPEVSGKAKDTADSLGVTLKSSLKPPMKGKRRQAVMDAIKTVVSDKAPSKKADGKGGLKY